jgi:hypothetical protein
VANELDELAGNFVQERNGGCRITIRNLADTLKSRLRIQAAPRLQQPWRWPPGKPGMKTTARNTERLAEPTHRPDPSVLCHEAELHIDSLAKHAAAVSGCRAPPSTSRRSCVGSRCSGLTRP